MAGFRRRRRRFIGRRRKGFRTFVRKVRRIARGTIRRMSEVKFAYANNAGLTTASGTVNIQEITPTTAEDTDKINARIGSRIKYKFLSSDINSYMEDTSTLANNAAFVMCRVVLISSRVTTVTASDMLDAAIFDVNTIWKVLNGSNVRVWRDWKFLAPINHVVAGFGDMGVLPAARRLKIRRKLNNNVTIRSGGSLVTSDPQDKFYIVWGYVQPTPSPTVAMRMYIYTRLSYYDF